MLLPLFLANKLASNQEQSLEIEVEFTSSSSPFQLPFNTPAFANSNGNSRTIVLDSGNENPNDARRAIMGSLLSQVLKNIISQRQEQASFNQFGTLQFEDDEVIPCSGPPAIFTEIVIPQVDHEKHENTDDLPCGMDSNNELPSLEVIIEADDADIEQPCGMDQNAMSIGTESHRMDSTTTAIESLIPSKLSDAYPVDTKYNSAPDTQKHMEAAPIERTEQETKKMGWFETWKTEMNQLDPIYEYLLLFIQSFLLVSIFLGVFTAMHAIATRTWNMYSPVGSMNGNYDDEEMKAGFQSDLKNDEEVNGSLLPSYSY